MRHAAHTGLAVLPPPLLALVLGSVLLNRLHVVLLSAREAVLLRAADDALQRAAQLRGLRGGQLPHALRNRLLVRWDLARLPDGRGRGARLREAEVAEA